MDIESKMRRIAYRKIVIEDISKINEKVKKENVELIKLQVAHDSAMWELKEKYAQVQGDHERLQQNMLELQMQYEALSGRYQDELRHRPETLNKLVATRKICDALEELAEESQQAAAATRADHAALYDAYNRADQLLGELRQAHLRLKERYAQDAAELQERLQAKSEHVNHMKEVYSECQQRADTEILYLKDALKGKEELSLAVHELQRNLDASKVELDKRMETIANLQGEMENQVTDFNGQLGEARNILIKKETDLKKASMEIESLNKALRNQEGYTKNVCDQYSSLQDQLALLDEEHQKAVAAYDSFKTKIGELTSTCESLNTVIATLKQDKQALLKEVDDKSETIALCEAELNKRALEADASIEQLTAALDKTTADRDSRANTVHILESKVETLRSEITDSETALKNYKETAEEKVKNLSVIIEEQRNEFEIKSSTLVQALKAEQKERADLEKELQEKEDEWKVKIQKASEIESALKTRVSLCEEKMRAKEEEASKELSKFLVERNEMEKEKRAYQQKISGLENRINNIMKEASNVHEAPAHSQPEPENDAVVFTPLHMFEPLPEKPQGDHFDYRTEESFDSLDPDIVRRRFAALARGERLLPDSECLESIKRRRPMAENVYPAPQPQTKERRFFKSIRSKADVKQKKKNTK